MIEIKKGSFNVRCQSCSKEVELYTLHIQNKHKSGVEISLCKDCCKELRSLLKFTQLKDFKMVNIDNIDKQY